MRPTDAQLDWIQRAYLDGAARPRPGVNVPPASRALAEGFRRRFRRRVSPQWIAAVVRMHFRGWPSERGRPLLTWAQVRFVRERYCAGTVGETTLALNRRFGTRFSARQIRNYISDRNRNRGRGGRRQRRFESSGDGRFERGHDRCVLPVGTETLVRNKDGRLHPAVKVDEPHPHTGRRGRMKPKRLVVWENANGPVPSGMCVVLLDGDPMNCELANLAAVTRAELARLNQMGWTSLPADRETRLAAVAAARLKQQAFDAAPSRATLWKRARA